MLIVSRAGFSVRTEFQTLGALNPRQVLGGGFLCKEVKVGFLVRTEFQTFGTLSL